MSYVERIETVQALLKQKGWDAFLLLHQDVHLNEYLLEEAKYRDFFIGFTGSAGDVLVLQDQVWLYADGRYHVQAEQEVPRSHVCVSKLGQEGAPTLKDHLAALPTEACIAYDPKGISVAYLERLQQGLYYKSFQWIAVEAHPIAALPVFQASLPAWSLPKAWRAVEAEVHGRSSLEKLSSLRHALREANTTGLLISKLDDIAWLTNTRGQDIPYNPVFKAFMWVDMTQACLFATPTATDDLTKNALKQLEIQGIALHPYEGFWDMLPPLAKGHTLYWTPSAHSQAILNHLTNSSISFKAGLNLIQAEKAIKTPEERKGMREANLRSSVAVVRTLAWLDAQAQAGLPVSERDIAQCIEAFYRAEGSVDLSFNTIAGIASNTAIIHYSTPSETVFAQAGDWILLDSGAQYPFGTTDITRCTTFAGVVPSAEHQKAYTHVLKSHIAGASSVFPKGSSGAQIDGICRHPLWQAGYDYVHGTGHGVGCFLNVHEGPNGISKAYTEPLPLHSINSIEPGYYVPDWGGIRLENLALVIEAPSLSLQAGTPQPTWYAFELLNWIPFASHLIDPQWLSPQEKQWLVDYHQAILKRLTPRLLEKDPAALAWLEQSCQSCRRVLS